jgi:methyl coenzyme M reductase subunit D
MLSEMSLGQTGATVIYEDNKGCIDLSLNPVHHGRSKHIDIKHHSIRDRVQDGQVKLEYVATEDNIADIFTKPLIAIKFKKFAAYIAK